MIRPFHRRFLPGSEEQGIAMIVVLLALTALMALSLAAVEYGVGSQYISRHDQNWNAALAAAQAGITDYMYRLNNSPNYVQYGNEGSQTPDPSNGAFTGWVNVPGSSTSKFRYDVDSTFNKTSLARNGSVTVTSTGKVGNATRTAQVSMRQRTYLDFLYFTDLEITDPLLTSQPSSCAQPHHAYSQPGVSAYPSNCSVIYFYGQGGFQDVINGPLHTNDQMNVCGDPQFNGLASTSYPGYPPDPSKPVKPTSQLWRGGGCSNDPNFSFNPDPTNLMYGDPLPPLPSNSALQQYTNPGTGGCYYKGPTKITFHSDGTWTVSSPTTTSNPNGCPLNNTAKPPANFNGVVYVDTASPTPSNCRNKKKLISGNLVGYPVKNDVTSYVCTDGDAFLSGQLNGQVTVGAAHDIVLVGSLVYHDKSVGVASYNGNDILGLIANRFVSVYHPVNSSGNELSGYLQNPEIDAAILSVQHSFYVQAWGKGSASNLGTLTVYGAIAQEYRGPVGTFGCGGGNGYCTGYSKNYNYDNRLKYLQPPYFLNPLSTQFGQSTWKELKPAYPAG